jgi:hypothetical protein
MWDLQTIREINKPKGVTSLALAKCLEKVFKEKAWRLIM